MRLTIMLYCKIPEGLLLIFSFAHLLPVICLGFEFGFLAAFSKHSSRRASQLWELPFSTQEPI